MNHRTPLFCQRWRERRATYRPAGETIITSDYEIAPITFQEAKAFCIRHHYSASYVSCRFRFGLFGRALTAHHWQANGLTPELLGVAVFSVPQHPAVLTNVFPGNPNDSVELGRFVLLDHVGANAETYFLSRCRELLKTKGLRGVVAFSDPEPRLTSTGILFPGHIGTIYQSLSPNTIFLGRGARKTIYLFNDGSTLQRRTISKIRNHESGFDYACEILIDHGADKPGNDPRGWLDHWLPILTTRVAHPGCFKYAFPLQTRVFPVGTPLPYPKQFASAAELPAKNSAGNRLMPLTT